MNKKLIIALALTNIVTLSILSYLYFTTKSQNESRDEVKPLQSQTINSSVTQGSSDDQISVIATITPSTTPTTTPTTSKPTQTPIVTPTSSAKTKSVFTNLIDKQGQKFNVSMIVNNELTIENEEQPGFPNRPNRIFLKQGSKRIMEFTMEYDMIKRETYTNATRVISPIDYVYRLTINNKLGQIKTNIIYASVLLSGERCTDDGVMAGVKSPCVFPGVFLTSENEVSVFCAEGYTKYCDTAFHDLYIGKD